MCRVTLSNYGDYDAWLKLAGEVEPLFGPMVNEAEFQQGLKQAIQQQQALCIRPENGSSLTALSGGVIISEKDNEILWLAVAANQRTRGMGNLLLSAALERLDQNRPITVITFDESVTEGIPARRLYQKYGFRDVSKGALNPAGITTVCMKRFP